MMIDIRNADNKDLSWLAIHDNHVSLEWLKNAIIDKNIMVLTAEDKLLGYLRYSYFWGKVPYMDLIYVLPEYRKNGYGKALFNFWEQTMRDDGFKTIMTSSMIEELEPQQWHLNNGFNKSGTLTFGDFQREEEIFFTKNL